jgi:hypothetical protein
MAVLVEEQTITISPVGSNGFIVKLNGFVIVSIPVSHKIAYILAALASAVSNLKYPISSVS